MKRIVQGGYSSRHGQRDPVTPANSGEVEIRMLGQALQPAAIESDPEELAFRALGFIAGQPAILRQFLAINRLTESELLRLPIRRKHFAAVLAFIVRDERLLGELSRRTGLSIEDIHRARHDLYRSMSGP